MKVIDRISYANGKIYVGKDLTDSINRDKRLNGGSERKASTQTFL